MSAPVLAADETLERIVRAIVERVRPQRIVLFGSRARGDARPHSDYDLMVELAFDEYFGCRRDVDRAAQVPGASVDIHLRKPGQLEARRDDPGRMDWDIWREGVVVYPPGALLASATAAATRKPGVVREGGPPPDSVQVWLERADEDLLDIENNVRSEHVPWGAVCFHAQQAAEKYVKALLIQCWIRPARTHDLHELVVAARAAGYELPDLAAECAALKEYAVDVRYPEYMPIPGERAGREILAAARPIIGAARRYL
jgi:HEPN domain-containing protein/predicted nucleotidyltransferase